MEGIKKLTENDLVVKDIVVLIDRSRNAGEILSREGYKLHSFLTIAELLSYYQDSGKVSENMVASVRRFINEE